MLAARLNLDPRISSSSMLPLGWVSEPNLTDRLIDHLIDQV
jgi:hypothetical protein